MLERMRNYHHFNMELKLIILGLVILFSQRIKRKTNPFLMRQKCLLKFQLLIRFRLKHLLFIQRRKVDSVKDGEIPLILLNIPGKYEGYGISLILLSPD